MIKNLGKKIIGRAVDQNSRTKDDSREFNQETTDFIKMLISDKITNKMQFKAVSIHGLPNSGTNLIFKLINEYFDCKISEYTNISHYKHCIMQDQFQYTTDKHYQDNMNYNEDILHIIITKEFLFWLLSIQKTAYTNHFKLTVSKDNVNELAQNKMIYSNKFMNQQIKYNSMYDLYNDYHIQIFNKKKFYIAIDYHQLLNNPDKVLLNLSNYLPKKKNIKLKKISKFMKKKSKNHGNCRNYKEAIKFYNDYKNMLVFNQSILLSYNNKINPVFNKYITKHQYEYFGELGYYLNVVLPFLIREQIPCILHTFEEYSFITKQYCSTIEFINYKFNKSSSRMWYHNSFTKDFPNIINLLPEYDESPLIKKMPLKELQFKYKKPIIGKRFTKLTLSELKTAILINPRIRTNQKNSYGNFNVKIYKEIIELFKNRKIIICGSAIETFDIKHSNNIYYANFEEIPYIASHCQLCLMTNSGMATYVIKSNPQKVLLICLKAINYINGGFGGGGGGEKNNMVSNHWKFLTYNLIFNSNVEIPDTLSFLYVDNNALSNYNKQEILVHANYKDVVCQKINNPIKKAQLFRMLFKNDIEIKRDKINNTIIYTLLNDININFPFIIEDNCIFDGNNFKININYNKNDFCGIFNTKKVHTKIVIKNLHLQSKNSILNSGYSYFITNKDKFQVIIENCSLTVNELNVPNTGGFIGSDCTNFEITNCFIKHFNPNKYVELKGVNVGGIVGKCAGINGKAIIQNCRSAVDILSPYSGGICGSDVGYNGNCLVSKCSIISPQNIGDEAGGICGRFAGRKGFCLIKECSAKINIDGYGSGGICGSFAGNNGKCIIKGCKMQGLINGISSGGICGIASGADGICEILDCNINCRILGYSTGGVCGLGAGGGEIAGSCFIGNCYVSGDIIGTNSGGICGSAAGFRNGICKIYTSTYNGEILGPGSGGICGSNSGFLGKLHIQKCIVEGIIDEEKAGIILGVNPFHTTNEHLKKTTENLLSKPNLNLKTIMNLNLKTIINQNLNMINQNLKPKSKMEDKIFFKLPSLQPKCIIDQCTTNVFPKIPNTRQVFTLDVLFHRLIEKTNIEKKYYFFGIEEESNKKIYKSLKNRKSIFI